MSAPDRPLDGPEALLWHLDRGAPLHFTTVAELSGEVSAAAISAGLAAAQARHPFLQATIVEGPGGPRFAPLVPEALALAEEVDVPEADFEARLAAELAQPMPSTGGPLLRATLLRHGPGRARLLLTLHHSIGDGRSGVYLARDVLQAAAGEPLAALPPAPTTWSARPASARGARAWWTILRGALRDLLRAARFGRPRPVAIESRAPLADRRPFVHTLRLAPDETARLTSACRAAGTTIHGLLTAVLAQTLAAEAGGPRALTCASPVDLRPHLSPPIGESLGYYVGLSQAVQRVDPAASPWPLSRAIRADLVADLARGAPATFHTLADLLFARLSRRHPTPAALCEALYGLPLRAGTGITNLGRLNVPDRYGAISLTGLYFAVAPSALADLVTTATCHAGTLFWTLVALDPHVSPVRAARLCAELRARLDRLPPAPGAA